MNLNNINNHLNLTIKNNKYEIRMACNNNIWTHRTKINKNKIFKILNNSNKMIMINKMINIQEVLIKQEKDQK